MHMPVKTLSWDAALAAYFDAKSAEDAYDRDVYMPAYRRWSDAVDEFGRSNVPAAALVPDDIEAEIARLQRRRHQAEDAVMSISAPDAAAFAHKVLIARGEGRAVDGWDGLLEAEALRFAPDARLAAVDERPSSLADLLNRYRDQMTALDAATDQDEIDRLADESFATLEELSATPAKGAWDLAAKLQAVVDRFADLDPPNMQFVKDALADAHRLSSDADFAFSWVQLWHDYGGFLTKSGYGRWYGKPARGTEAPAEGWSSMPVEPHLVLRNHDEWWGAMKAMETLFEMSSTRARDAIFALAPATKQEG